MRIRDQQTVILHLPDAERSDTQHHFHSTTSPHAPHADSAGMLVYAVVNHSSSCDRYNRFFLSLYSNDSDAGSDAQTLRIGRPLLPRHTAR